MIEPAPRLPGGTNLLAHWQRWVERSIMALRPQDTPNALAIRTTRGTAILTSPGKGGKSATPLTIDHCSFFTMYKDHMTCLLTSTGVTKFIRVAKPPLLRFSLATRTVRGNALTYSYPGTPSDQIRVSTFNSGGFRSTQQQLISDG